MKIKEIWVVHEDGKFLTTFLTEAGARKFCRARIRKGYEHKGKIEETNAGGSSRQLVFKYAWRGGDNKNYSRYIILSYRSRYIE